MYTFILMVIEYFENGTVHWYMFFILFILIRWIIVQFFALQYRPYRCENKDLFSTVIVPVVDEPLDLFNDVLIRIADQNPNEVIIVVNGPPNPRLVNACKDLRRHLKKTGKYESMELKVIYTPKPGKRNAVKIGLRHTSHDSDITVLVDSDTVWTKDTLKNLLMPFSMDETIGGVTTRQKILEPGRNLITMIASLLEEIRAEGTMKAMSVTGKVGCLPGRTIAFRTSILREAMHEFMTETFMGIHKEVSDDRSLTNITLKMGYKTVMQDTSVIYTDCPLQWKKFLRQQLRWAEGSQYNNIRMTPWMAKHAKLMCFIYWSDMIMPFLLISTYTNALLCFIFRVLGWGIVSVTYLVPVWMILILMFVGAGFGMGTRNLKALLQLPPYFMFVLPFITFVLSFVMAPLRIIGLMKCADGLAWGTRAIEVQEPEPKQKELST
ncbi:MAG: glycosyltransferase [Solobacterium sp.]|nr:glycosyltransferase [Solobacterium sp.]